MQKMVLLEMMLPNQNECQLFFNSVGFYKVNKIRGSATKVVFLGIAVIIFILFLDLLIFLVLLHQTVSLKSSYDFKHLS